MQFYHVYPVYLVSAAHKNFAVLVHLFIKYTLYTGERYGQLDSSTKSGYNVEFVSEEIIRSVAESRRELVLAPMYVRLAILMRSLAPGLYRYVMARRAAKERKQQ